MVNIGFVSILQSPFVDSTTSSGTCFEPRSNSTELPDSQNMPLINTSTLPSASIPADSVQISELLARTITDAHTRTYEKHLLYQ